MPRRVVDCFIFYNELDMLECRLRELWDVVDVFVLAEGTTTFRGEPKPLYFAENHVRFAAYRDKILPIAARLDGDSCWPREFSLRNSLSLGLNGLGLAEDDLCVLSDVDEIPDARTLALLRVAGVDGVQALSQDFYYYNLTCKAVYPWVSARVLPWRIMREMQIQRVRQTVPQSTVQRGGWHFSNFLAPDLIANKYRTGAHEGEFERFFENMDAIKERIADRKDIFGRDQVQFRCVPIDGNTYLPREIEMFKHFFGTPSDALSSLGSECRR